MKSAKIDLTYCVDKYIVQLISEENLEIFFLLIRYSFFASFYSFLYFDAFIYNL